MYGPPALAVGAVFSTTVTLKLPVLVLPVLSVAEQLTMVCPIGNNEPEAGKQVTGTEPSTASRAEAVKVTTAPEAFCAGTFISAGNVKTGGTLSITIKFTVTWKLPVAVLVWVSVAEQFTVVCPMGNNEPDAGEQFTVTEPSTRSVAEAEKVTTVPRLFEVVTVISAGNDNVGGVVSTTVTVKEAVPVFPWVSVATQLTVVVPSANVEPEAGEQDCELTASSGSEAEAKYVTAAPDGPVASTLLILAGTVHTGGVVSMGAGIE